MHIDSYVEYRYWSPYTYTNIIFHFFALTSRKLKNVHAFTKLYFCREKHSNKHESQYMLLLDTGLASSILGVTLKETTAKVVVINCPKRRPMPIEYIPAYFLSCICKNIGIYSLHLHFFSFFCLEYKTEFFSQAQKSFYSKSKKEKKTAYVPFQLQTNYQKCFCNF